MNRSISEDVARVIVRTAQKLASHRLSVAMIGLVLTLSAGLGYVVTDSLGFNPVLAVRTITVQLGESGGLLPGQDVTMRGVPVGKVTAVTPGESGVTATVRIDAGTDIPRDSAVRVSALSAAGEQYLDFRPTGSTGPFLRDGDTVARGRTATPVPFAQLIGDAQGVLAQIDPAALSAIARELRVSPQGPQKLSAIIDGGTFLIATLDSVLPETTQVLRDSRTAFTLLSATSSGLRHTAHNLRSIATGVSRMEGGYRRLLDSGRTVLPEIDALTADNSETMVQLLGNLATIAQLSYVRIPALQALFPPPERRGSVLDALATTIHDDGGVWALGDIYPRYSCDYNLPRAAPSQADFPEPFRYTFCTNPDPSVLIRGARNAPRPPGDDTALPPAGYDPHATTDPAPVGPHTIPLPYGGPDLDTAPPN